MYSSAARISAASAVATRPSARPKCACTSALAEALVIGRVIGALHPQHLLVEVERAARGADRNRGGFGDEKRRDAAEIHRVRVQSGALAGSDPRPGATAKIVRCAGTNASSATIRFEPVPCMPITCQSSTMRYWLRSSTTWMTCVVGLPSGR